VCKTLGKIEGIAHIKGKPDYDQLYEIAEGQAGNFTANQARSVGFSWERLSGNVKTGKFKRIAHGIYRLSHFPGSPYEDLFVALLRTGPASVISHESALSVYDLSEVLPGDNHVIIPRTGSRRREGIKLHTNRLAQNEITNREGLRVTTVERTIADVTSAGLPEDQVHTAIVDAIQSGLTTRERLIAMAERRRGRVKKIILQSLRGEI
jgi:predicted transcriptional regulator of viral defense system